MQVSIFWLAKSKLDKALNRGNGLGARGVWISTGKTAEGDVCWRDKGNTSQLCVNVHGCACNVCVYTMICAATGAWLLPRGLSCPDATSSPAAGGIYTENVEIDISVCAYIYIFLPADFHTAQQEQGARRDTGAVCIGVNTLGICDLCGQLCICIYTCSIHMLCMYLPAGNMCSAPQLVGPAGMEMWQTCHCQIQPHFLLPAVAGKASYVP